MTECEHDSYTETGRDSHFIDTQKELGLPSLTYHYIEFICDHCGEHVYEKYQYLGTCSREEIGEAWTYYEV